MLEGLEDRLLLYATLGAQWVYGSRITYSFVPDGANVGGYPSALFQTLNAKYSTAQWQQQFQKAAAVWQAVANINFSQVSDDGTPLGAAGNQQGDSRFGDIRISAIPQGSGTLAVCFMPPPVNGGTDAGDIVLNSTSAWGINTNYDLETMAIHELGHAIGMDHSQVTYACMYAFYNGTKQSLTTDDISGIQSVWGAPQSDAFNSNGQNNGLYTKAANITSYVDANGQVAIPNLKLSKASQAEWFSVTAPANTTGTLVATVQASGLSMLTARVQVYTSSLTTLGSATTTGYGGTATVTINGVQSGQTYLVRANGDSTGTTQGAFGLELNFGSVYQPPICPPNTVVPEQPDQGSGGINKKVTLIKIGNYTSWGEALTTADVTGQDSRPIKGGPENRPQPAGGGSNGSVTTLDPPAGLTHTHQRLDGAGGRSHGQNHHDHAPGAGTRHHLALQAVDTALSTWTARRKGSIESLINA